MAIIRYIYTHFKRIHPLMKESAKPIEERSSDERFAGKVLSMSRFVELRKNLAEIREARKRYEDELVRIDARDVVVDFSEAFDLGMHIESHEGQTFVLVEGIRMDIKEALKARCQEVIERLQNEEITLQSQSSDEE